jgi:hypothetical protein
MEARTDRLFLSWLGRNSTCIVERFGDWGLVRLVVGISHLDGWLKRKGMVDWLEGLVVMMFV